MSILIIAEHDNQSLKPATLNTVTAAASLGLPIDLLVAGADCQAAAEQAAKVSGINRVLVADNSSYQHQLAEAVTPLVVELAADYQHIYAPASSQGKNLLPQVAALLDVGQISDVTTVIDAETFLRPIYAGNAIARVRSLDSTKVVSVRTSAFDPAAQEGQAEIIVLSSSHEQSRSQFVEQSLAESERPDLGSARTIISGGRGMGSGENFALLDAVADKLGAAIGASRAAVDAGFVANDLQVGQTGKIVAPDLYIAVGISGAIQHLAGMKDSKVIVAINNDEDAPIFQVADYGLVGDLFTVLPELEQQL